MVDAAMWSGIRSTKHRKPMGCRAFSFELFAGLVLLSATAAAAGYAISQPADIELDGADLREARVGKVMERVFATDDPFLSTFAFSRGPWNHLTQVNMCRSEGTRAHWDRIRAQHLPMLWWIADTARTRISKGRLFS